MKRYISKSGFILLFFLFSLTIFSTETTSSRATKMGEEDGIPLESSSSTESKENATIKMSDNDKKKDAELKSEKKDEKATEDKEDAITQPKQKDETEEKKILSEDEKDTEFSSIQVSGLTLANGNKWYFEEYDENGNIIGTISYDNNKMISKSSIEYNDGKKKSEILTEQKKITKILYNDKGIEVAREEYQNKKGEIGKSLNSSNNIYDDDGKIKEEIKTENGITVRTVYTYEKDKKVSETVYENDVKTIFIEYKEGKKIVHIFDEDIEINVFEEAIE